MIDEKCLLEILPDVEYFDLYQNLKSNLEDYLKNCKDKVDNINNFGYYCLNCKFSFCNDCTFLSHRDHNYIKKSMYEMEPEVLDNVFRRLQVEIESNKILNPEERKNQIIQNLSDQIEALQHKLEEYKERKIDEINNLFDSITCIGDNFNKSIYETKSGLQNFFEKNKKFFNSDKFNKDRENTVFLLIFELLNSCYRKNNEMAIILSKLEENAACLEGNLNQKIDEITRLLENPADSANESSDNQSIFDEILKGFSSLEKDHYSEIKFKINRYNEHIDNFKNLTFENIVRSEGISDLEALIRVYDRKNKNKTTVAVEDFADSKVSENYNSQSAIKEIRKISEAEITKFSEKLENRGVGEEKKRAEENKLIRSSNFRLSSPTKFNRSTGFSKNLTGTAPQKKTKKFFLKTEATVNENDNNTHFVESNTPVNFKTRDDVTLENRVIQRYFAYQTLDLVNKYFRIKDNKNIRQGTSFFYIPVKDLEMEIEDEVCKPLIGTNEIQIYDRKKRVIVKKKVLLSKQIHGYTRFLDGVRYYLHNDKLFITGGRDEIQDYKIVLSYDLKTYTLKRLGDMLYARSYHTMHYNGLFKTLMVISGQNNATCELYDMKVNKWRMIPSLNYPRANVSVHFDDIENNIYAFFGVEGDIARKTGQDYSYIVEVLKLKNIKLGWVKIDYNNKSDLIFKQVYLEIFPLPNDKVLIYGGKNLRNTTKNQFAVYLLNKNDIVKIDNKMMDELRIRAKKSPRLSRIITNL